MNRKSVCIGWDFDHPESLWVQGGILTTLNVCVYRGGILTILKVCAYRVGINQAWP